MADDTHDREAIADADNPEWTEEDFARARPFDEVFPELAASTKNRGGRPKLSEPKVHLGFRFAAPLAASIKAIGKNYNARVEAVLQRAMDEGTL